MSEKKTIAIIGAGGMAREVEWLLRAQNERAERWNVLGYVVSDTSKLCDRDSPVLGGFGWLLEHEAKIDALALGIGSPGPRLSIAAELSSTFGPERWPALIHPTAVFDSASCTFEQGVVVSANVTATVNVCFEAFSLTNFAASIGHESRIGRGSVVNPGARISGGVTIEEGVLVGSGAIVLQYRTLKKRSRVGAGAVVTHDVESGATVVGVPARPRETT